MAITLTALPTDITNQTTNGHIGHTNIVHNAVNSLTAGAQSARMNLRSQVGVVGDGVADDATAINNAATAAASLGVSLYASGTFKILSTVTLRGDTDMASATFNYSGTGIAVQVGSTVSGDRLFRCEIKLPKVINTLKTGIGWTAVTGSTGVRVSSLYSCFVMVPHIQGFATGLWVHSVQPNGTSYTEFRLGHLDNNKVNLLLSPDSSGVGSTSGWVNQNTFIGGRLYHNSNEGTVISGAKEIDIATSTNLINNNHFLNTSLESANVVQYHIDCDGRFNYFTSCRFEASGGSTHPVRWGANTRGNIIDGGFEAGQITETLVAGAAQNDIRSDIRQRFTLGSSTVAAIQIENPGSSAGPALRGMAAGALAAATDPTTGWLWQITGQKMEGKQTSDAAARIQIDFNSGRLYCGPGTGAPTGYISAGSTSFLVNALHWSPVTTATLDLGITSFLWRDLNCSRYVRAGTAVQTGAVATGSRPTAATAGAGAMVFDTTLNKPIWSTGSAWVDATGTTV